MSITTTNNAHQTLDGAKLWGLVDASDVTVKAWRPANVVGDYGDARVVAYDAGGASAAPVFTNAAAMADGAANPTAGGVGTFGRAFNGTTWDRLRSNPGGVGLSATGILGVMPVLRRNSDGTISSLSDALSLSDTETGLRFAGAALMAWDGTQFGRVRMTSGGNGAVQIGLWNGAGTVAIGSINDADAVATSSNQVQVGAKLVGFNGTTWDRLRTASPTGGVSGTTGLLAAPLHVWSSAGSYAALLSAGAASDGSTGNQNLPFMAYNGATFDRLRTAGGITSTMGLAVTPFGSTGTAPLFPNAAATADGAALPTTTMVNSVGLGVRTATSLLDAVRLGRGNSDAITADVNTSGYFSVAFNHGFNGTTWDRLRAGSPSTVVTTGVLRTMINGYSGHVMAEAGSLADSETGDNTLGVGLTLYGGATWARARYASAFASGHGSPAGIQVVSPVLYVGSNDLRSAYAAYALAAGNDGSRLPAAASYLHNGSTFDPARNNTEGTLLASSARTASTNTATQTHYNGDGTLFLYLDVTANPGGAETLQIIAYGVSPIPGTRVQVVAFTAIPAAANGQYGFMVGPDLTEALAPTAGTFAARARATVPRSWSVQVVHSAAGSWTYSLGYAQNS